ncbi:MAG: 4-carboxy-4-hydroxy-2-oxoadipate aldolase/oxaloacetate decarboxylase [Thaumarchaeota archaeon]|nr:4-carboxy-4-hydroxy-2-oxoadipate aldolase/oxaloacetate decarboxylase [Candidatus Calditenuaceae archaeon]MDW8186689.1 4-carboxy-4-hydroxy-2-oxoadipate aldolase/oxaloacetate decarboxylase [Nitrososphaerota archaeon]
MTSIVYRDFPKLPREIIDAFKDLGASTVYESISKEYRCVMDPEIKPIAQDVKLVGPALTVNSYPADNVTVHRAMALAKPGDVIVIAASGLLGVMWGGLMSYQAKRQGIAGVVVDGSVRDVAEIRRMGFPVFARHVSPIGSSKMHPGSINVPVICGGVLVKPGDVIVGDDDGVVVVPREIAAEVLQRAKQREERERESRRLYDQGKTSYEIYGFEKVFREKGVQEFPMAP